jgi:hypothetical protein
MHRRQREGALGLHGLHKAMAVAYPPPPRVMMQILLVNIAGGVKVAPGVAVGPPGSPGGGGGVAPRGGIGRGGGVGPHSDLFLAMRHHLSMI